MKKDSLHIWDELQYLDIDDKRTKEAIEKGEIPKGTVFATGGGKYPLPVEKYKNAKIIIRNYMGEDPDAGELFVEDWRMVGLIEGIEERGTSRDGEIYQSL